MTDPFLIAAVVHDPKRGYTDGVVLLSQDAREVVLALDGDCCSVSYFEENSLKDLKGLIGETLTTIKHVDSEKQGTDIHDCVTVYHALQITTNKQSITVDWRNESNGYYDGTCTVIGFPCS